MPRKMEVTLDSIKELECGVPYAAYQQELRKAVADCVDRPGDKSVRTVSMVMSVNPVVDSSGQCERATMSLKISSRLPAMRTRDYSVAVTKNGNMVIDVDSPDDVTQMTLPLENPKTEGDDGGLDSGSD